MASSGFQVRFKACNRGLQTGVRLRSGFFDALASLMQKRPRTLSRPVSARGQNNADCRTCERCRDKRVWNEVDDRDNHDAANRSNQSIDQTNCWLVRFGRPAPNLKAKRNQGHDCRTV